MDVGAFFRDYGTPFVAPKEWLKSHKWVFVSFVVVFVALLIVWAIPGSPSFQKCFNDSEHTKTYHQLYENGSGVTKGIARVRLNIGCVLENNDLITAIASLLIAGFTWTLWRTTTTQAKLTREAIELGNREFIASHRPKLRIRRMRFVGYVGTSGRPERISHGDEVEIGIEIVNVGGAPATMINGGYSIEFTQESSFAEPRFERQLANGPIAFAVGEKHSFTMRAKAMLNRPGDDTQWINQFRQQGWSLIIFGEIVYRDDDGCDRRTGFTRRWNWETQDPTFDYEYED